MKRINGIWYVNACEIRVHNGRYVKVSHWQIAGTFERACLMMGGHVQEEGMVKTFGISGDFKAYYAACEWCKENGISYGSMQRDDPIGLMRGDWDISKWRNMTKKEQDALDGVMTGDKRSGPVTITMKDN